MCPIKSLYWRKGISLLVIVCFIVTGLNVSYSKAQEFTLPKPGVMVPLSPSFNPPVLKGIKVHPDNPFKFDFVLDPGDSAFAEASASAAYLKQEATRLIKYFLASLTIPEKDLWVNLSPYEKDRIVPESFGQTEMGRDLLAQDYLLKQITASLIYPEDEIGKKFWKRVYAEAQKKYGTTQVPVNTFNKVWIVPEKAVVYENAKAGTAYVVESKLKVMLEEDYLATEKGKAPNSWAKTDFKTELATLSIIREIIIPELTKEINEGKNFAQLRQVYQSLILATWYKKKIKGSILSYVYADKNKIVGVNIHDPQEKQRIYLQYLQAFKKGVYNYIKEEPMTGIPSKEQGILPRKYFAGGVQLFDLAMSTSGKLQYTNHTPSNQNNILVVTVDMAMQAKPVGDRAMLPDEDPPEWNTFHEINDNSPLDTEFTHRFSKYKYGSIPEGEAFAEQIYERINEQLGNSIRENPQDWFIVTPPYSSVKPAIYSVAVGVAARLGIPLVDIRATPSTNPSIFYAAIASPEERTRVGFEPKTHLDTSVSVRGKKAILIEDIINTGSTARQAEWQLKGQDGVSEMYVFGIIRLKTATPALENKISSYIVKDGDFNELIGILNAPGFQMNRYTLKSIFIQTDKDFRSLIGRCSVTTLQQLQTAASAYFGKKFHMQYQQLIQEVLLKKRIDALQGRSLILSAGPSGAGKTTMSQLFESAYQDGDRKIVRILADDYPSEQRPRRYGMVDLDDLASYNQEKLLHDINLLLSGEEVFLPPPFHHPTREKRRVRLGANDLLWVDGLHVLHSQFLERLPPQAIGIRLFVDAPWPLRFMRNISLAKYQHHDFWMILKRWYLVREAEARFVSPTRKNAETFVDTEHLVEIRQLDKATSDLRAQMRASIPKGTGHELKAETERILDDVEDYLLSARVAAGEIVFEPGRIEVLNPNRHIDLKAVVFDWDGVIQHSIPKIQEWELGFLSQFFYGESYTEEQQRGVVEHLDDPLPALFEWLRFQPGILPKAFSWPDFLIHYRDYMARKLTDNQGTWRQDMPLVDGIVNFLQALNGKSLYVSSYFLESLKMIQVQSTGLGEFFKQPIYGLESVHFPAGEYTKMAVVKRVIQETGFHEDQIAMVEDRVSTLRGMKELGIVTIAIAPDAVKAQKFRDAGVDVLIHGDFRDLKSIKDALQMTPSQNRAMITPKNTGGIDLTSDKALKIKDDGQKSIQFNIDPAMLAQLQNATGFAPVIINIQPMTDLRRFLEVI